MRSIPMDDLLNVGIDGGFNGKFIQRTFKDFYFDYLALQATVVTIQELKESILNEGSNETFIVQCFLTQFDLDGSLNQLITKRW